MSLPPAIGRGLWLVDTADMEKDQLPITVVVDAFDHAAGIALDARVALIAVNGFQHFTSW